MIKLYLKTLSIVLVATCLVLFIYHLSFSYFTEENFNSINRLISKGTFSYFQTVLKKTSQSKWESAVAILQPNDEPAAKILPIKSLQLSKKDKLQLFKGNIVPTLLKHVIDNLITNALKFAKENILLSLETNKNFIFIHIDDDGPGIPTSEIKNIFEPFVTLSTDQSFGKHIGLGLPIVKAILDLHKGFIQVTQSKN